ncbi:MAG: ABC transporter permease [Chloroflexi bacterium]|nr:ABC transporter permease [Chloroflexota bacterium]MDA1145517.1 ABC transporter permease [Chloroflexota bacterium]
MQETGWLDGVPGAANAPGVTGGAGVVRAPRASLGVQLRRSLAVALPPLVALVVLVIAWEFWVRERQIAEYLVPRPSAVFEALRDDPGRFATAARESLAAALGGLLVASLGAFALAVVMAHSRLLERALYPPALMIKVTPIVAVYPLFAIWFGFGIGPKIAIAALIAFFPMLVNALIGLRAVDPAALDFMRALDASRWRVLWSLRLPSALPYVFAALRISVPLSLIGAVVAEFLSGSSGMGQLILIANGDFDTPVLFGAIVVLSTLGVILTALVAYIERRVLFWHASMTGS